MTINLVIAVYSKSFASGTIKVKVFILKSKSYTLAGVGLERRGALDIWRFGFWSLRVRLGRWRVEEGGCLEFDRAGRAGRKRRRIRRRIHKENESKNKSEKAKERGAHMARTRERGFESEEFSKSERGDVAISPSVSPLSLGSIHNKLAGRNNGPVPEANIANIVRKFACAELWARDGPPA